MLGKGKGNPGEEVEKPVREISEGADFVVMFSCADCRGYRFLSEPVKWVTKRGITGIDIRGKKFSILGGTVIERQIISRDMTIDDALGGIYHTSEFQSSTTDKKYGSSEKYLAYGQINGKTFGVTCRKPMEIVGDSEVKLIDKDLRVIRLFGAGLEVFCYQINDDDENSHDDGEPYDLKSLGAPMGVKNNRT